MACFLLVRFSSIGDVLLTTPLVRALRARHPDAEIVFVTKHAMAPLVADNHSYYGMDAPHAVIKQPAGTRLHARMDGLGNVLALTDTSGAIQTGYEYDDWGKRLTSSDNLGFNGKDRARWKGALWLGPELDFYYMRARWYEPQSGRFLSEDPIGLEGGMNPIVFAGNDPVNHADPAGLQFPIDPVTIIGQAPDWWAQYMAYVDAVWAKFAYAPGGRRFRGELMKELGNGAPTMGYAFVVRLGGRLVSEASGDCKKELREAAIAGGAQALQVGIAKGVIQMATSGRWAAAARFARGNRMPLMAGRMNSNAVRDAAFGALRYNAAVTLTAAQAVEAWYNDAPGWYDALKFLPGLGTGMEIGEAINVCLLN